MNNTLKTMFRFIKLSYKINKTFVFSLILDIILNIILTFSTLKIVQEVTVFLTERNFEVLPISLISLLILIFGVSLLKVSLKWKIQLYSKKYLLEIDQALLKKSMNIDYYNLELVEFQNLQEQVKFSLRNQYCIENLLEALINFIENITIVITSFFVIGYFSITLGIILIFCLVINILNKFSYSKKEQLFYENLAPINRKYWYYSMMIFNRDNMLDIKANRMNDFVDKKFENCNKDMMNFFSPFYIRKERSETISFLITNLTNILFICISAFNVYNNKIDFPEFNISIAVIIKFSHGLKSISENLIDIVRYTKYCKSILDLLDYKEIIYNENSFEKTKDIIAKNISFKYKDGQDEILKDISFEVENPKAVLIIGENGSGKSTLIKLLSGLYDVKVGNLTVNNEKIYNKNIVSTLFQDFKIIDDITIRENICCKLIESQEEKLIVDKKIKEICEKYSIKIPDNINLDSTLGVELDDNNVELSGGQLQLIAILRALYKNTDIIILDEPQSFLDVEKEKMLYDIIEKLKKEKYIFLISHKLNAVNIADEIWLMEKGKIISKGKHKSLYENCKSYKKLYDLQKEKYLENQII